MTDIMFYAFAVLSFSIVIIIFLYLVLKIVKSPKYLFYGTKYLGIKKVSLSFTLFNTFIMRNFIVQRNQTYEVVYKLETKEGKITMTLDDQIFEETTSRLEGSKLMTFNKMRPVVKIVGTEAKNGHASVVLYKK